jgi:hypothetical protein
MIDPKIAIKAEDENVPGEFLTQVSAMSKNNPVRNTRWDYLFFTDSSVFSPAAKAFSESKIKNKGTQLPPAYTDALEGTQSYNDFWRQERDRCLNGYEVGGVRITGEHYFYLNYCIISKRIIKDNGLEVKELGFPDFTTMDYYWFLELERNENPLQYGLDSTEKRSMIMAKARRKGWSYKNAGGATWIYTFFKNSRVVIASQYGDKSEQTFKMFLEMSNFLNEYTEFRQPRLISRQDIVVSGWEETINGVKVTKGKKSEVRTLSLKDNPDKSAGLSVTRFIFEEAGQIKELKAAYRFAEPTLRDGASWIGIAIIFGTGGDMENATQDFADMFYNPDSYGLASYDNIYEESDLSKKCGWFVDEMWFRPNIKFIGKDGKLYKSIDENGNACRWLAEIDLNRERERSKSATKKDYDVLITQKCKTPSEAFLRPQGNVFPVAELYDRLVSLTSNDKYKRIATAGSLSFTRDAEKLVKFTPDLKGELYPIFNYPVKQSQTVEGAVLIYEAPPQGEYPSSLYKIGYDPVRFARAGSKSLASILVYKQFISFEHTYDVLVAEYRGRRDDIDEINEICLMLSLYYGKAEVMVENEAGHDCFNYFKRKGYAYLLAAQPDDLMAKYLKAPKVKRVYGAPMNDKMKEVGEKLINNWLISKRGKDEDDRFVYNMDLIPSVPLLQELISYNREGNFDSVMSLMMLLMLVEEREIREVKETQTINIAEQLLSRINEK